MPRKTLRPLCVHIYIYICIYIYIYIYIYYFSFLKLIYNPSINFSRQTHIDCSCIFYGFFQVPWYRLRCQLAFKFHFHCHLQKGLFCFPWLIKSLAWTLARFLSLYLVKIKSDDGYQIRWQIYCLMIIIQFCIKWSILSNENLQKLIGGGGLFKQ